MQQDYARRIPIEETPCIWHYVGTSDYLMKDSCVYGDASVTFFLGDVKAARSLLVYMHPTLNDINRPGEALTLRAQAFPSFFLLLPQLGLSSISAFLVLSFSWYPSMIALFGSITAS
ncbi:uncharacterized protein APUU_11492S [Aspergillus puulaauensis]|uniref:Uncharacterized protein n=1 Tax=Aspergillus puulaauensis TaxID=1220207 RepID=A0A7R7XC88_9EURO|nr:uncharacterized protein APUU_11492S [Aspergillus puulaauensis]BCS18664.1 hypothetical protein APUU_11492S [Aspergillus puulaauensis]